MKKKIVGILVFMLLIAGILVVPDYPIVKADICKKAIGLDYNFMWNITKNLSHIIFDYPSDMIPKGRAFGTWGEHYAANDIIAQNMSNIGLYNITLDLINANLIDDCYNNTDNKTEVIDFALNYSYKGGDPVPIDCCPFPAQRGSLTNNYTGTDLRVRKWWWTPSNVSNISTYINCETVNEGLIVGNITYVASDDTLPVDQECRVFLFEDVEGCQGKMDNITNASGFIIMSENLIGQKNYNATNCSVNGVEISNEDGNWIKELLENETVLTINLDDEGNLKEDNLTIYHNLNEEFGDDPDYDFIYIDTIFNGLVNTNDLTYGSGTYRVYAAFRDPDGNILQCDDDTYLVATWEFTVTFS